MGYETNIEGRAVITPAPSENLRNFINKLCTTRRMGRNIDSGCGIQGEFFVDGSGTFGQGSEDNIIDHNTPPTTQPGLWCKWEITGEDVIEWSGMEKFYGYTKWLVYLIEKILKPNGHTVNGDFIYDGEEARDSGRIIVRDNVVTLVDVWEATSIIQTAPDSMRTDIVYTEVGSQDVDAEPEEVTAYITIAVKLKSYEYDNPETILEEFCTETQYNFPSTDCVEVVSTEIYDSILR